MQLPARQQIQARQQLSISMQSMAPQKPEVNAEPRRVLDQMVKALGGDAWLKIKTVREEGHVASFHRGRPTGALTEYREYRQSGRVRSEFGRRHDVAQILAGRQGWEITYKGTKQLPAGQTQQLLRDRDHAIETVVRVWLANPKTLLLDAGQHMVERRLAEEITVVSAENELVTIFVDTETHLPLRRSYRWRDPIDKQQNLEVEEYDDYHVLSGIATAFLVSRFKNEELIRQRFVSRQFYNESFAANLFDAEVVNRAVPRD